MFVDVYKRSDYNGWYLVRRDCPDAFAYYLIPDGDVVATKRLAAYITNSPVYQLVAKNFQFK